MKKKASPKTKPGPSPERLKAEGADWKDALSHAMNKPKPKGGWPKGPGKPKP